MVNIFFWIINYKTLTLLYITNDKLSFPLRVSSVNVTLSIWSHLLKKSLKTSVFAQWIINSQYCKVPLMKDFIADASIFMGCQDWVSGLLHDYCYLPFWSYESHIDRAYFAFWHLSIRIYCRNFCNWAFWCSSISWTFGTEVIWKDSIKQLFRKTSKCF